MRSRSLVYPRESATSALRSAARLILLAAFAPAACEGGPAHPGTGTDTGNSTPSVVLQIVSGRGQADTIGATLKPMVIRSVDASGAVVPNVALRWANALATGSFPTATDANGEASVTLTVGDYAPRTGSLTATPLGPTGEPAGNAAVVTFGVMTGRASAACPLIGSPEIKQRGTQSYGVVQLDNCITDRKGNSVPLTLVTHAPFVAVWDSVTLRNENGPIPFYGLTAAKNAISGDTATVEFDDAQTGSMILLTRAHYLPEVVGQTSTRTWVGFVFDMRYDVTKGGWKCPKCVP